jgi:predicted ribonuclease YlaK
MVALPTPAMNKRLSFLPSSLEEMSWWTPLREGMTALLSSRKGNLPLLTHLSLCSSGKTETIRCIAAALSDKRIQVLTYNKQLMSDTAMRLKSYDNVSIHTYHGFVTQIYKIPCPDDSLLNAYVEGRSDFERREVIPATDILIIDEAQDLTPLLYKLVSTICHDLNSSPQLVILGDRDQVCILCLAKYLE